MIILPKKYVQDGARVFGGATSDNIDFGSPDHLDDLPMIEDGAVVGENDIRSTYDHESIAFPSTWGTDARLCLKAAAPRPCTVLAAIADAEVHD